MKPVPYNYKSPAGHVPDATVAIKIGIWKPAILRDGAAGTTFGNPPIIAVPPAAQATAD